LSAEGGVHQFVFLERVEGYGVQIMKGYNFDPRVTPCDLLPLPASTT